MPKNPLQITNLIQEIKTLLDKAKKQVVQEFVTIETVEDIESCLPEISSVNQQIFIELFEKVRGNYRQIQSLTRSCDELLPRLMRGEVRVEM